MFDSKKKEAPAKAAPAAAEDENIVVGEVYKEKDGEGEVIPYFVDVAAGRVNFAGVGRSNEENMATSKFLSSHEHVGPVSSRAEDQKSNEEALKDNEKARKEEERRAEERRDDPRAGKTGV